MAAEPKPIYLSSPHMGGEELDYIHEAFEKNWIAPLGANVNGFEQDLQDYTGRGHAAVITSGTAGIHLALILCGVKPGDEVICQSFTFAATANPIRYQRAVPVFVDSEPETWNMDPDLLEKAILDRLAKGDKSADKRSTTAESPSSEESRNGGLPKAIIVVHLYGMPAKMERILEIGNKYNIPVIEDAAEALGSSIEGRRCGTFGRLSVLSFNGNKIITTSGGGALLGDDGKMIQKARFLATQARDDAPHYQHSEIGYNYRMSNIVAGIGRGQMKVLDNHVDLRRANHKYYFENLGKTWFEGVGVFANGSAVGSHNSSPSGIYFLKEPEGYFSNRWLSTILVNPKETDGVTREDIRIALDRENIESRPLWKPMHLQPVYEKYPYYSQASPTAVEKEGVSDFLFEYGLCLPSGSNLTGSNRERVVHAIRQVLE
ncbi:DegT/DnrJ/EryC1/StrS family aminotransferase [soil metagenome]